jgi:glycosyltransferase involved in cell wall biosynthesis
MKEIVLLHPFTPKAAGVKETSVASYHSQPHAKALQVFAEAYPEANVSIDYFTEEWCGYQFKQGRILYRLFSISRDFKGNWKKWKKQQSPACLRAFKKQCPDVTIINMSGHSSPFSHQLAKLIISQDKQYVAMLGGQDYLDTPENRWYYKQANHILVHTELQKQDMLTMSMFKNIDIRVFPLGVDCEVFSPKGEVNYSGPKLLYVGRIVEWKRIHLAIEAVALLVKNGFSDAYLDIIGPVFSDKYMNQIQLLIKEKKLSTNVTCHALKKHVELPYYFQHADLFCLPSDRETFGMVMIEAMACGTPVAAINCPGGPSDVIINNVDGILSSPENYADSILKLFRNRELLKEMKVNARNKVLQKYSIAGTTRALNESINLALKK